MPDPLPRPADAPSIRAVTAADAPAIFAIRTQPLVMRFTTAEPGDLPERTAAFLAGIGERDRLVVAEIAGEVVGMCGLHRGRGKQGHSAELGIMVHDAWHGRGIGGALLAEQLDHADHAWRLDRVWLEVMADNPSAIRLYERLGFREEGRKRRAVRRPEGDIDLLVMGRLRSESA